MLPTGQRRPVDSRPNSSFKPSATRTHRKLPALVTPLSRRTPFEDHNATLTPFPCLISPPLRAHPPEYTSRTLIKSASCRVVKEIYPCTDLIGKSPTSFFVVGEGAKPSDGVPIPPSPNGGLDAGRNSSSPTAPTPPTRAAQVPTPAGAAPCARRWSYPMPREGGLNPRPCARDARSDSSVGPDRTASRAPPRNRAPPPPRGGGWSASARSCR